MLAALSRYLAHPHALQLEVLSLGPEVVARRIARQTSNPMIFGGWGLPALLNLLVCLPIGALLFPYVERVRTAATAGLTLSLAVELTQLTGTWGLFPCPYRKFDADDLLLNTIGVALGFLAAQRWRTSPAK
jgi:glycopeptide antibiotics resistance protein